jgi:hypothetical protein
MMSLRLLPATVMATIVTAGAVGCHGTDSDLPQVAQRFPEPPQVAPVSIPPAPGPETPIILSPSEKAAIEQLRRRGASVAVFRGSGDTLVHFPLGQLERQWRKQGLPAAQCGVSIAYSFTPDDTGPPMTDADLAYLDALPRLSRVNLAGTSVTPKAIHSFREQHRRIVVEERK